MTDKKTRLSYTGRAQDIVRQMSLSEKIGLMAANYGLKSYFSKKGYNVVPYEAGGNQRLGVPAIKFCDGPRGVVSGHSTCFPVAIACGATFDTELNERVGDAIGQEVRAHGANFYAGVCVNLPYNPGDGRTQESFGEDSYHVGEIAAARIRGVQKNNVIACVKHFAFNSMERARFKVNVIASKRAEQEVFLPHFRRAIDEGVGAMMSSYNKYQGEHCGHNAYLLREVAKKQWDFDGPVMSDFILGVRSAEGGISGGCDIEMRFRWRYSEKAIRRGLKKGKITEAMIDEAALRIVRTVLAFSESPDPMVYTPELIACKEHIALAREVAEKSVTMLKNESLLPFRNIKRLALVGDLADTANIGDHGSSMVRPPYVVTLLQAMRENYPEIETVYVPTKEVNVRLEGIRACDAAVVVCGMNHGDEGEYIWGIARKTIGGDRATLGLHAPDIDMIRQVCAIQKTAVLLMGGSAITMHDWKDLPKAIMMTYYPGMEGGNALADILFGKVSPSGKLPFVIAKNDTDYPHVDWNAKEQTYEYYHGYRKLDKEGKEADFPFGFGLSYTSFAISGLTVCTTTEEAVFSGTLTNTGAVFGGEVVQLYIGFPGSAVDRPVKTLRGFQKLYLAPGESGHFELAVKKSELAYYDEARGEFRQEDLNYAAFIGTDAENAADSRLNFCFEA
ncbi:MAG: glycosyl hydrolase [Subdoligranulum sp.]|nr:glycosyl hydrolase [Subdoligranulum sp.]